MRGPISFVRGPGPVHTDNLQGFIELRYRAALLMIAALMIGSFLWVAWVLSAQMADAPSINVSGRQRMLSQRVLLLAHQLHDSAETAGAGVDRSRLLAAIQEMQTAHQALAYGDPGRGFGPPPSAVADVYFGPDALDERVAAYLADARALSEVGADVPVRMTLLQSMHERADDALLGSLNEVVTRFEAAGTSRVRWLQLGQLSLLVCMLLLLLMLDVAIFRPMVAMVASHTQALEQEVEERRAAEHRASESARVKGRFLAKMSHELRTPLNAVIGYTELLAETDDPEESADCIARVLRAAQHQLSMVNDLLDLERAALVGWSLDRREVDLEGLIEGVVSTVEPACRANGSEIEVRIQPSLPTLTTDPVRLSQVLLNLVSNAAKFTVDGLVTISAVRTDHEPCQLVVSVADDGPGICSEDQERIFDVFVQVDDSTTREHAGSGLGLSICRELVEAMGGTLTLQSAVGAGSTFTMTIPFEGHAV